MNSKSEILKSARKHVQDLMKSNDPSHDIYHVDRVFKNAIHLYESESNSNNLDLLVIQLAALFHDVVDFKYDHSNNKTMEEIAEERLAKFFQQFKEECSQEQKEKIIYIIMNVSWRKELEMKGSNMIIPGELKIVRDADRLDAIGAIGIARCFAFSGVKFRPFFVEEIKPMHQMSAEDYNRQTVLNQSTAINHFHEKLMLIKDKMQTKSGKQIAENRTEFMSAYLKQFDNELNLLD